jgi:glycosyltransferase involved in cell wall biosynthesis
MLHNYYQQRGGEDESFEAEADMLERAGLEVIRYTRHNSEVQAISAPRLALSTLWNHRSYSEVGELLKQHRPDVLHATNLFPLISPSVFHAARRAGVPTVQSLRNYRHFCAEGTLYRSGATCRECQGRVPAWPALRHRCYRGSLALTSVVVAKQTIHRTIGTWNKLVDRYFAVSNFARDQHVLAGFPAHKIDVKPNSPRADFGPGPGSGGFGLYAGRLSAEKGVLTLLNAWSESAPLPLKILGAGPLEPEVEKAAAQSPLIEYMGHKPWQEVLRTMQAASMVLVPSVCPEPFGRVVAESLACGTPIVAARSGGLADLLSSERTGLLFEPGNSFDLKQVVSGLHGLSPNQMKEMRHAARNEFERLYSEGKNLKTLLAIYQRAREQSRL